MNKYYKYAPTRITLNVGQILELEKQVVAGKKLIDIAKSIGVSYFKMQSNMKILGLKNPRKVFDNKRVSLQVTIPRKHYKHARKRFEEIIRQEYNINDKVQI